MLDTSKCGLDTSSLHRATSMDISLYKKFRLLSCHRDTFSYTRNKAKEKLRILNFNSQLSFYNQFLSLAI